MTTTAQPPTTHRSAVKSPTRHCRYVDLDNQPCSGAATEDDAPILLCSRHMALALEYLKRAVLAHVREAV